MNKAVFFILVLSCSHFVYGQKENSLLRKGNKKYEKENYEDAENDYLKALDKNGTSETGIFNLGDAMYSQERFEDAMAQFKLAAELFETDEQRAKAFHNIGNSFMEQEKYAESVKAYKEALRYNPSDMETKYNLAYANEMLRSKQQDGEGENDQQNEENEENEEEQEQDKDSKGDNQEQQEQEEGESQEQQNSEQEGQEGNEQKPQQPGEGEEQQVQRLSKEEAARILEALQNEEQKLQRKLMLQKNKSERVKIEKDW